MIYLKSKVYPEVFIKIGFQFHYMVFHIVKRTSCFTIYVHGATTLAIKTFNITINESRHSAQWHSIQSAVMLNIIYAECPIKPFMLSVIMLSFVMLNVVAPYAFSWSIDNSQHRKYAFKPGHERRSNWIGPSLARQC